MWALFEKVDNEWVGRGFTEHEEKVSEFTEEYEWYLVDRASAIDPSDVTPVNETKAIWLED